MAFITIDNLSFTYPKAVESALKQISMTIEQGELVVLCGKSGCGKTTLLKMLKPALAPHGEVTGNICYNHTPLADLNEKALASEIGFVMQNPESQIVTDKVWHELVFGLENIGIEPAVIRRRVGEMASFFGIQHLFREKTADLSGGQKQLLNLASILVMQPRLLILDEPTSQLDPIAAADFINTLAKLNKELGLTIILVEHRLEEVFPLADRVIVMDQGHIIMNNTPQKVGENLKQHPQGEEMAYGLPSAVRIFNGLEIEDQCPLTVRDGRAFLLKHFKPNSSQLDQPLSVQSDEKETVLEAKSVCFRYERSAPDVLYKVDLSLKKGEVFAILGGNGVGKSTLLSVLSGQRRPYKGKVLVHDKLLKHYKQNELYKHNLALLPQNPQTLFLKKTVGEDYREIAKVMGYSKAEIAELTAEKLTMLGISHLVDQHPYDLSGGEQQKAAIGKILLLQPKIVLLDEPTKGLDAYSKRVLTAIIKELVQQGISILMVTHDVEFAAENADRCGLFFDRELISIDKTPAFFANNMFYTTGANRMGRDLYPQAITTEQVIAEALTSLEDSI